MTAKIVFQSITANIKRWLTPPRTLYITKTGWKFLGLTLIVGFAAVNTGNNLLYLVFGLMLSFIITSGVLSEVMLRKIQIFRTFPRHIFAQQSVSVVVEIVNRKQHFASFSLLFEDLSQGAYTAHSRYVLKIPPQRIVAITYPVTFAWRGLHRLGKIRLSTRYPFGLFCKSAIFIETEDEILIYPHVKKLQPADMPDLTMYTGDFEASKKGDSSEIRGIREYIQGDSNAWIHWKSTAKFSRLMTKEFEEEQRKKISLILDVTQPMQNPPATFFEEVENAISLTTSYLMYFIKRDFQVQLIAPDHKSVFDHGKRHLFALLRTLALLQPSNGNSQHNLSKAIRALNRAHATKILISVNNLNSYKQANFSKVVKIGSTAE